MLDEEVSHFHGPGPNIVGEKAVKDAVSARMDADDPTFRRLLFPLLQQQ
jgi:hypothetical protein